MHKYFKKISNTNKIQKSKGFSDEFIKPPATDDNSLAPSLGYNGT